MDIGHAVKCVTTGMPVLITGGVPGCRAGDERLASVRPDLWVTEHFDVESKAFEPGTGIPAKYSADGGGISPPLAWSGLPMGTESLALIVEDPDAPTPNPFVHWLLYNIRRDLREIPEDVRHEELAAKAGGAMQGKNSNLKIGWTGMAPPQGDTPHHYHFQFFALDRMLPLSPGAGRTALLDAMAGHVIAKGGIVGTYQR